MSSNLGKPSSNGDVSFGPNKSGSTYISTSKHRNPKNDHACWSGSITRNYEFDLFSCCEGWKIVSDGNMWGVFDNGNLILGTREERLSFYPKKANQHDPWHGYPVSQGEDYKVPKEVFSEWVKKKIVEGITARRIVGRKI